MSRFRRHSFRLLAGSLALLLCLGGAQAQPAGSKDEARMLELSSLAAKAPADAEAAARQWIEEAQRSGAVSTEAYARIVLGALWRRQGRYDLAAVELGRARELALATGAPELQARVHAELGVAYALAGLHEEALQALRESERLYIELKDWRRASGMLANIGSSLGEAGDQRASREYYQRALQMKRDHGIEAGIGGIYNNLADLATEQGDWHGALEAIERAIAANRSSGPEESLTLSLLNSVEILANLDRFPLAFERLAEAQSQLDAGGAGRLHAFAESTRAKLLLMSSEDLPADERAPVLNEALAAHARASSIAAAMDDPARRASLARLGSDIHAALGDWKQALELRDVAEREQSEADSRVNRERYAVLAAQYADERQTREMAELRERESRQAAELGQQRLWASLAAVLVLGLAGLAAVLGRQNRERRRHTLRLEAHNQALSRALDQAESMRLRAERFAALNTRLLQLAGDDLRAPLLRMRHVAERLLVERSSDPSLSRQLAVVAEVSGELMRTAEQMVERGAMAVAGLSESPPVDVRELVMGVVADAQSRLAGSGRELRLVGTAEPCPVRVDATRLQLLINELLALVWEAAPRSQLISIDVRRLEQRIEVAIDDPGAQLRERFAGDDDAEDLDAVTLGALWIREAVNGLGGELGFDGPPLFERPRLWLRIDIASTAPRDPGGERAGSEQQQRREQERSAG